MIRFKDLSRYVALAGALLLLAGCSGDEEASTAAQAPGAGGESVLLTYIPADTPYVMANTKATSEEVLDLLWKISEPGLKQADVAFAKAREELAAKQELKPEDRLARAILAELEGHMSREGLASLGLEAKGNFAFYGLGILPVVRMDVVQPQVLMATLERIEQNADQEFDRRTLEGVEYFAAGDADGHFIFAINGDQLILSLLPTAGLDQLLPQVLGIEKPASSLADSGRLEQVNDEYGLLPWGTLVVDTESLVGQILDPEWDAMRAMLAEGRQPLSDACKNEYRAMATIMPQIVSGYTAFNPESIDQYSLVRLRDDLAAELVTIKAAIPGLGNTDGGMFNLAMGLDVLKTKQFVSNRFAAIAAQPYECENLVKLNEQAMQAQQQLNQPLPPFVSKLRGLRLRLDSLSMGGEATGSSMAQGSGMLMVAMDNPQLVLGMAQAFVPELANLQLSMDGEPAPLPENLIPGGAEAPHVAMVPTGLGVSLGTSQAAELKAYVSADAPAEPPLLSMAYDAEALAAYQNQMLSMMQPEADVEVSGMEEVLERVIMTVDLTPRGIEMVATTELKP